MPVYCADHNHGTIDWLLRGIFNAIIEVPSTCGAQGICNDFSSYSLHFTADSIKYVAVTKYVRHVHSRVLAANAEDIHAETQL